VLGDAKTRWERVQLAYWYGGGAYELEMTSGCALWHHHGKPVVPLRWVLVRDPVGKQKPRAFLCTDQQASPQDILAWFVRRWSMEVTFEETRRHLGGETQRQWVETQRQWVETQRQWSDKAILRTTPCLLGLFSLVTLMAQQLHTRHQPTPTSTAWYEKTLPTFCDSLASVRMVPWRHTGFSMSHSKTDMFIIPRPLFDRLTVALAYTA